MSYETECKNLELMKLRFGDRNLHNCEVMLRDIKDSERINRAVQKQYKEKNEADQSNAEQLNVQKLYVKVVSTGYWDKFMECEDEEYAPEADPESDRQNGRPKRAKFGEGFAPSKILRSSFDEFENQYQFYKR